MTTVQRSGRIGRDVLFKNSCAFACVGRTVVFVFVDDGVDDVVSAMRDIDGVELAIVLRELESGEIRGNIRSQDYFDCSKFAEIYGGGGHLRAAGFTAKNIEIYKLAEEIVSKVQDAL